MVKLAAFWLWEVLTYYAWGLAGYPSPSRLSTVHYRAESRLRRAEAARDRDDPAARQG